MTVEARIPIIGFATWSGEFGALVEDDRRLLGPDHPDTLGTHGNPVFRVDRA